MKPILTQVQEMKGKRYSDFVKRVFDTSVAADYSAEGVSEFYRYIEPSAFQLRQDNQHHLLIEEKEGEIIGLLEIRKAEHIALFFVKEDCQRQGIGRRLLGQAVEYCRQRHQGEGCLTVNSSPNAVGAYRRMGFESTSEEQEKNGIRFVPMKKVLNNFCQ